MRNRWLLRMGMAAMLVPAATADILDDLGVPKTQLVYSFRFADPRGPLPGGETFLGVPFSAEHIIAIEAEMERFHDGNLALFREGRGEFAQALEVKEITLFQRVRLLVRLGKIDEARTVLEGKSAELALSARDCVHSLRRACRPLEDAEAWAELDTFLGLLAERLVTPDWRSALWSEELDLAWHHDRLQKLLDEAAEHPLRLAFFQNRLGNEAERDRLAGALLENAETERVIELLDLIPACPLVLNAAARIWNRDDLAAEQRVKLFDSLSVGQGAKDFLELFRNWLQAGGDGTPLAPSIWQRWQAVSRGSSLDGVLPTLLKRYPDEPFFQMMWAGQVVKSDPALAIEICEKVAKLPLNPGSGAASGIGKPDDGPTNLPYLAIRTLGSLDCQDRIRTLVDAHPGWSELSLVDQARYLAAGKMDFAMVDTVLNADFSKPENDVLAGELGKVLTTRLRERVMPREQAQQIVEKFATLVAGSPLKSSDQASDDARVLIDILAEENELDELPAAIQQLTETVEKRGDSRLATPDEQLPSVVARHPEVKEALRTEKPVGRSATVDMAQGLEAAVLIRLFAPPEIRRIVPEFSPPPFYQELVRRPSELPFDLLDRWDINRGIPMGPFRMPGMDSPLNAEQQNGIQTLMRQFGEGNPRRLMAEIMISQGLLDCGDEALKSEAQTSFDALMAGKKEARGSEAFRYAVVAAKGQKDPLLSVLGEVKSQPPSLQQAFLKALESRRQNRFGLDLARTELEVAAAIPAVQPLVKAAADPDIEKFTKLMQQNQPASAESIELSMRLLDKAMMGDPAANQFASQTQRVLAASGNFEAWIEAAGDKLRARGLAEVDVLRGLQKFDPRESADGVPHGIIYDRKILALDPADQPSAKALVYGAAAEGDSELLLACFRALGPDNFYQLVRNGVLENLGKEGAPSILAIVRELGFGESSPSEEALTGLHGYFLAADPALASEFRTWLTSQDNALAAIRLPIATQLMDAGHKADSVDVIASCFVTPPEYPGFPHQFPPQPGKQISPNSRNSRRYSVRNLQKDLDFMRKRQLFPAVISRIEALGSADPIALLAFRMAENPDGPILEEVVLPMINQKGDPQRTMWISDWIYLFTTQPDAGPLVLRLFEERVNPAFDGTRLIVDAIGRTAELPGSSQLIAKLWLRLAKEPDDSQSALAGKRSLLRPMLLAADDTTWQSYWAWRVADGQPLGNLSKISNRTAPDPSIAAARLQQVLPQATAEIGGEIEVVDATGWALSAMATGEPELMKAVKSKLPAAASEAVDLCDLGTGDPMALSPLFGAAVEGNGETLLWWNPFVLPPVNREIETYETPPPPFPALDGKFEIQITAGKQPDRQVIVAKIPHASAASHVRLKLAPDQRYVSLLATDSASGVVRWTHPLDLRENPGLPLSLTDAELTTLGFKQQPTGGPGGLPAWGVQLSSNQRIDLLERPWNGSDPVKLSAWKTGVGSLVLHCYDASGKELQAFPVTSSSPVSRTWKFRSIQLPEKTKMPAATVRMVLSVETRGSDNLPSFLFSNLCMEIGPSPELPPDFEKIGRVPGAPAALALSPDASRLAVVLLSGEVAIFELATGKVTQISSLPDSKDGHQAVKMAWGSTGIHLNGADGWLYRVNEQDRKLDRLLLLQPGGRRYGEPEFEISSDGKWIATRIAGRKVLLVSTDGTKRRKFSGPSYSTIKFTADGLVLGDPNRRQRFLLKTENLTDGDPVEIPAAEASPPPTTRWQFENDSNGRRPDKIQIPAPQGAAVIAPTGQLIYMDSGGNVIRSVTGH